jgi:hypothetical protein
MRRTRIGDIIIFALFLKEKKLQEDKRKYTIEPASSKLGTGVHSWGPNGQVIALTTNTFYCQD